MDQNLLDIDKKLFELRSKCNIQYILESHSWSKIQNHFDPRLKLFGHGPKNFGHGPKLYLTYKMTGLQNIAKVTSF